MVGVVERCEGGRVYATQRGRFFDGDTIEILAPGQRPVSLTAHDLWDGDGQPVTTVNRAMMPFSFPCDQTFPPNTLIRIAEGEDTEDREIQ